MTQTVTIAPRWRYTAAAYWRATEMEQPQGWTESDARAYGATQRPLHQITDGWVVWFKGSWRKVDQRVTHEGQIFLFLHDRVTPDVFSFRETILGFHPVGHTLRSQWEVARDALSEDVANGNLGFAMEQHRQQLIDWFNAKIRSRFEV